MLHEFVRTHRDAIVTKTDGKVREHPWRPASMLNSEHGVAVFLGQLADTLQYDSTPTPTADAAIEASATLHGRELLDRGFSVSQVVHDYGDICQALTEMAAETNAPITTREFHVLNRCLDIAIAMAVTEHARVSAESRAKEELERLGRVAHEIRNRLNTALLAFTIIKDGQVAIAGATGSVLGRSLIGLRDLVDGTLAEIRTAASHHRPELVSMQAFINDIALAAQLQAEYKGVVYEAEPVDPALVIDVDRQLLESAVMNLLSNGFKYTHAGGRVALRARAEGGRALIDVEDGCGGIPETRGDPFRPFGDRRGKDRTGLGLGLSIARKAIRAQGGDVRVTNLPGRGCIFTIDLPMALMKETPSVVSGT